MCVRERRGCGGGGAKLSGGKRQLWEGYGIGCAGITSHASIRSPCYTATCPMGVHDAKQMLNVKKKISLQNIGKEKC